MKYNLLCYVWISVEVAVHGGSISSHVLWLHQDILYIMYMGADSVNCIHLTSESWCISVIVVVSSCQNLNS